MSFAKFLSEFKTLSRATVEEAEATVSGFKSTIPSLEEAITSMKMTKNSSGFIRVGEESVGLVNRTLREADLAKVIEISGKNIPITSRQAKLFEEIVAVTPERSLKNLETVSVKNIRDYPHLNVTSVNFNTLSSSAVKDVGKVEGNLLKTLKTGTIVGLTIGAVVVGTGWVLKATRQRIGCFMVTTINSKSSSCKVQAYSCTGTEDYACPSVVQYHNITLLLMHAAMSSDTDDFKMKIAAATGVKVGELKSKMASLLDNNYNAVHDVIEKYTPKPAINICGLRDSSIEGGVVPVCRMCSTVADPKSTEYIDPKQVPDNVAFQCVTNPSILDTITDAAITTGIDLFDGVKSGLFKILKPLAIGFVVLVVVFFIISIVIRIAKQQVANSFNKTISGSNSNSSINDSNATNAVRRPLITTT